MTEPITRTELYWRVDNWFHENYPDAPQQLSATDPAHQRWREVWIAQRDHQLNEEVNRVYWARYPDAPTKLDDSSPEWEKWRVSWTNLWHEVMDRAPEPGEVQLQNAVSNDGQLDLSHIKAAVREMLVDAHKDHVVLEDTFEEAVRLADQLCEEVGAQAMAAGTVDGSWQSREASVKGLGNEKVELQVTGWWGDGYFTGRTSISQSSIHS
jgi:hypothetical protein